MPAGILGQPRSALFIPGAPPEPVTLSASACTIAVGSLTLAVTSQRTVIGTATVTAGTLTLSVTSTTLVIGIATVSAGTLSLAATSQRTVLGTASLTSARLALTVVIVLPAVGTGIPGAPGALLIPGLPIQPPRPVGMNAVDLSLGGVTLSATGSGFSASVAITLPALSLAVTATQRTTFASVSITGPQLLLLLRPQVPRAQAPIAAAAAL